MFVLAAGRSRRDQQVSFILSFPTNFLGNQTTLKNLAISFFCFLLVLYLKTEIGTGNVGGSRKIPFRLLCIYFSDFPENILMYFLK